MDTKAQSAKAPVVEGDRNYPDDLEAPRGAEEWMDDPAILEAWMSSLVSVRGRSQATARRYRRLVERLLEDTGKPIAQVARDLGVDIPAQAIDDYRAVVDAARTLLANELLLAQTSRMVGLGGLDAGPLPGDAAGIGLLEDRDAPAVHHQGPVLGGDFGAGDMSRGLDVFTFDASRGKKGGKPKGKP